MGTSIFWPLPVSIQNKIIQLRKKKGLTQQTMADAIGVHVNQIKRYEAGTTSPSLEVLKNIALTLNVSLDELVFDDNERGPNQDLILQFEAVSQLPPNEQQVIKEVLDGLIIKYQTRRWDSTREQQATG